MSGTSQISQLQRFRDFSESSAAKIAKEYVTNIARHTGFGLMWSAKVLITDDVEKWRIFQQSTACAAIAASLGPLTYQVIKKVNDGSREYSRSLGLKKAIELPSELGSLLLLPFITSLFCQRIGLMSIRKKLDYPEFFIQRLRVLCFIRASSFL